MSNTPDTDANQIFLGLNPDEGDYFVPAKIARRLEQQRNEAVDNYETAVLREYRMQEQLDALKESILDLSHPNIQLLLEERNETRKQRDRLTTIANDLIAMIRINVMRGSFEGCTVVQLDEHLKPWIEKIAAVTKERDIHKAKPDFWDGFAFNTTIGNESHECHTKNGRRRSTCERRQS